MSTESKDPDRYCAFLGYYRNDDEEPNRKSTTWCGRIMNTQGEFVYLDATHALLASRNGSASVLCRGCALGIAKQARNAT